MFCRNCGQEAGPGAAVCVKCGVRLGTGRTFCHNCGKPTAPIAVACTSCGAALNGGGQGCPASIIISGSRQLFFPIA